jgi:ABC-type nitrate/sulfonate/bicarbonate transport system permease component
MFNNPNNIKTSFYVCIIILIIWILLTEIVFTGSQVFPSPTLVTLSFYDLFANYNFLINLVSSISAFYVSLFIGFILIRIKFPFINFRSKTIKYLMQIPSFFLIIPEIMIGVILIYWFRDSYLIKLFFAVYINAMVIYKSILKFDEAAINNYILAAKSLGVSDQSLKRKIAWKFIEPKILNDVMDRHSFLWSLLIVFEFIQNYEGIGMVLRKALEYHDLSILITLTIILVLFVLLGEMLLKIINNKYLFWN